MMSKLWLIFFPETEMILKNWKPLIMTLMSH